MTLAATSEMSNLWELKEVSENVFKRRLEQIDGIAQAAVAGGLQREIHDRPGLGGARRGELQRAGR
jgi:multidrug efflux pump subunit AcrB